MISYIVSQHFEEADFLYRLRTSAISAPHYALIDLAKLDDRVEAHLDGLRVAGEAGWELCKATLSDEEDGEVFAASAMAFESGIESRIQAGIEAVQKTSELSKGIISALGWMSSQQAAPHTQRLLVAESPLQQLVGLAACAVHRQDSGVSDEDRHGR